MALYMAIPLYCAMCPKNKLFIDYKPPANKYLFIRTYDQTSNEIKWLISLIIFFTEHLMFMTDNNLVKK